jgi:serine/threonine protein kinase
MTSGNINQNLDKILALNMPYGGVDLRDYLDDNIDKTNMSTYFLNINTSLIKLLVNGIIPMNKLNVYHCDVKSSNVLIQDPDDILTARLIDWGLSVHIQNQNSTNIPKKLSRRPFQFNTPFSVILFNKIFVEKYTAFIELHFKKGPINYYSIREFVINYIFIWNKIRGIGHLKTINLNIKKLTYNSLHTIQNEKVKNQLIEYEFTYYYIIEYISKILFKYTINGQLLLLDYFNNVFLKTIDIWGFIMIYINFLDQIYALYGYNNLNENQSLFVNKIKYIVVHFLFESPTESIVTNRLDELVSELQDLNGIIANFNKKGQKNNDNVFLLSNKDIKELGGSKIETRKNRRKP